MQVVTLIHSATGRSMDLDVWTVRSDAIIAVHEWSDGVPPANKCCTVEFITGKSLTCRNDYRELCETLWPGSTGYAKELEQTVKELNAFISEGSGGEAQ